jgi:hypothetical protein
MVGKLVVRKENGALGHHWCHPRPSRDPLSHSTKKGAKRAAEKSITKLSRDKTE